VKSITSPTQAAAIQALGHEPILIIKIDWSSGTKYYGPKEMIIGSIYVLGKLIEVSPIASQKKQDNVGMVSVVSVTLDDLDGLLKTTIDTVGIEYTPATIYQFFQGLDEADLMQIYKGQVIGPIEWSEGKRTLQFEIETRLRDLEVGFSADILSIPYLNPDAIDKAWPLAFGSVIHSPALKLITAPVGRLKYPFKGPRDPSQPLTTDPYFNDRQFTLQDGDGAYFPSGSIRVQIDGVIFEGSFSGDVFTVTDSNVPKYENVLFGNRGDNVPVIAGAPTDPDINTAYVAWLLTPISIVNNYVYIQSSTGSYYLRVVRQENNKIWFSEKVSNEDPLGEVGSGSYHLFNIGESISQVAKNGRSGWALTISSPGNDLPQEVSVIGRVPWSFQADAEVSLWQPSHKDVYIANLIPTTAIRGVYAQKKIKDGGTELVPIPLAYYTINLNDSIDVHNVSGTVTVHPTTLTFDTPLRDYVGQGWSDVVYVTLQSTVGPNTADIISWMYSNYSSLSVDSGSFSDVHTLIDNYPSSFTLFDKENVQSLAEKIAWQARCGLVVDNGTIFIKYLSKQPTADVTIDEDSTQLKTLALTYTRTEDIVTRFHATYKLTYFPAKRFEKEINYVNNIAKFGLHKKDYDFFIYNIPSLVTKSVNFWAYRYSNSWRLARLNTFLEGLRLEIFDCVSLAFADTTLLNTASILTIVDKHTYNASNDEIGLELWLPSLSGTSSVDPKAWMDDSADTMPTDPSLKYVPTIRDFQLADDESKYRTVTSKQIGGSEPGIISAIVAPVGDSSSSDNADSTANAMVVTVYGNGFGTTPTRTGVVATPIDPLNYPVVGQRISLFARNGKSYISNASASSPGLQEFDTLDLDGDTYGDLPTEEPRLIQFGVRNAWNYITKKIEQVAGTFGPIGGWLKFPGKSPRTLSQWAQVFPAKVTSAGAVTPILDSSLVQDPYLDELSVTSIDGSTPSIGDVGVVVRGSTLAGMAAIFVPSAAASTNATKICKVIAPYGAVAVNWNFAPGDGYIVWQVNWPDTSDTPGGDVTIGPPFAAQELNGSTTVSVGAYVIITDGVGYPAPSLFVAP